MIGNFLVRSALKFSQEHSKSSQKRLKSNRERTKIRQPNGNLQIHRPKQSININDRFTRISTIVYCITCTLRKKIHTGETERKFADRFREHLCYVEKKTQFQPPESPFPQYDNLRPLELPTPRKHRKRQNTPTKT